MQYGICYLPLIPLRSEPSEKAEMVTQILFGQLFRLTDSNEEWSRVEIIDDSYSGWCTTKMLQFLPENEYLKISRLRYHILDEPLTKCFPLSSDNEFMFLPAGSHLYIDDISGEQFMTFVIWRAAGDLIKSEIWRADYSPKRIQIHPVNVALEFLNAPYLWGGKSVCGIDCSGLVQVAYSVSGINIGRDASDQAKCGDIIDSVDNAMPGDLAFFVNSKGFISHVGICMGQGLIIHSSGSVHIDCLDERGIYNKSGIYTHELKFVRRIKIS
jgi:gamma-D-glutamyl-L-lysine dipeptidyl-peptidase